MWKKNTGRRKKPASYSHRTATTAHPCYIPVLGDSAGAGRIRLAGAQRYEKSILKNQLVGIFKKKAASDVRQPFLVPALGFFLYLKNTGF